MHYERKLLGVKQWYKIKIEWTDEMLKELFEDSIFKSLKNEIENWQKLKSFHNPGSSLSKLHTDRESEETAEAVAKNSNLLTAEN